MKSDEYLWEKIVKPVFRQMYKESEPSADFDELIEKGESTEPQFFEKYYLSQDRQDEIMNEHLKKFKLNKLEESKVKTTLYLGPAPNGVKTP